jgi:expansin (peptidoglycan-binding protein)
MNRFLAPALVAAAFLVAYAQPDSGNVIHSGQATYYNATGDGNCMFGPSPSDLMVCAMNNTEYDTARVCGASIRIQGPQGEVTVRIVDRCPECPRGNVDLSKQAFATIADTIQGRVAITWWYVETNVSGPIEYRVKTGSNAWWIGIQVLNHRTPVAKLEALRNDTFVQVPRMEYNYFVDTTGLGPGPFTVRVTDFYGQQLTDTNIPLSPDAITAGHANFSGPAHVLETAAPRLQTGRLAAVLVTRLGNLHGLPSGAYDAYTPNGCFIGRIDASGSTKGLDMGKIARNGILVLKPASVQR